MLYRGMRPAMAPPGTGRFPVAATCPASTPQERAVLRPAGLHRCECDRLHTLRMDWNAYRDENETDQPVSYWRRRAIALAVGLSLFGLLAWVFPGGGGKPASPVKSSQAAGISPAAAYSSAPTSSPKGADGSGHALASPSASGQARATRSAAAVTPPRESTRSAPAVTPSRESTGLAGDCSPSAVVLSLFSARSEYHSGQDPEFDLYAVSTASGTCSFDTAPESLHVVVISAGHIIWDSADCARGETSRVARLRRGIPAQEAVTWNRAITLSGCVTLASSASPGTYQVQARAADVVSLVRTFKLGDLLPAGVPGAGTLLAGARGRSPGRRRAPGGRPVPPLPASAVKARQRAPGGRRRPPGR